MIRVMIELDIPQLLYDGIEFGDDCFDYIYSIHSSSIHSIISSQFDATGLGNSISFVSQEPSSTSHVVTNRAELDSIPLDVEDLWIGLFDTTELTAYSFDKFQSLRSLVIGNSAFWSITSFELRSLPSLQSIDIGQYCFYWTLSFSLTSLID